MTRGAVLAVTVLSLVLAASFPPASLAASFPPASFAGGDWSQGHARRGTIPLVEGTLLPAITPIASRADASPSPAASQSPSLAGATVAPSEAAGSGDTRSPGQGPGFVGAPALAILGVLAIGLLAAALTLVYVRLTGGSHADILGSRDDRAAPGGRDPR